MKIRKPTIILISFFILIGTLLIILESYPNFPDADSFYHAKMATIIRDQGFIKTLPWLQETVFAQNYVDHHLLYHLLLIPFVTFFDPLVGMKISAVIFGLLAFLGLYWLLRTWRVPWPEWLTLAAALSSNFMARMSLPRAPSLSLLFLLIGTWALIEKKLWTIFIVTILFVWLYNGWPLLLVAAACIVAGKFLTDLFFSTESKLVPVFLKTLKKDGLIFLPLLGGIIFGLIVNPYFPQNLSFNFLHILKIGFLNATNSDIAVGSEWYPPDILSSLHDNVGVLVVALFAIMVFLPTIVFKRENGLATKDRPIIEKMFSIFLFTAGLIIMNLKSYRYFEYSIPFIILAAGLFLHLAEPFLNQEIKPFFQKIINNRKKKILAAFLLIIVLGCLSFKVWKETKYAGDYFQAQQFVLATDWAKKYVPVNETVFHNTWDFSLILWYLDDTHKYLLGLDPMFMADKNRERFDLWLALANGEEKDVSKIISDFGARTVIVDLRVNSSQDLMTSLEQSGLFSQVAANQWIRVYAANELLYENSYNRAGL